MPPILPPSRHLLGIMGIAFLLALPAVTEEKSTQPKADGPSNEKAQKTYRNALEALRARDPALALDGFKKADKQDDGNASPARER
jgi:outer membrane protein assembly factor BamD (BamD/ComL family)